MKKGTNASTLWNYDDMLKAVGNNVETNLFFDEMKSIQKNYGEARKHVEQLQIDGSGAKIDGIWYYNVPEEERTSVQNRLKEHLRL
ncbi:hypothetical protein J6TS1_48530 [Siminovitchia terrae]|uniref:Uncharacterized protein n=1 Tax=Siminovitchia terrae TaxID=1914933 RepID=A0ABQ4L3X8_SIMTE|nr:hypothetical protein J6TS1_48530 [Siminovitchia terrae]